MDNDTSIIQFYILPFSMKANDKLLIFSVFFLIYLTGIMVNIVIITVICLDSRLHTPMYLFLCNLSFVDMCYTTISVPKLLDMLRVGISTISFPECFTQVYFYFLAASTEVTLLFVMGYDRYIAICHPLHYHHILSKKICIVLLIIIWLYAGLNSMFYTFSVLILSFCHSLTIHQFFCEPKALINISCSGSNMFYIVTFVDLVFFGICPILSNVMSYIKIISVILRIKSKDGRRKAFSTCSSHLSVMIIYYVICISVYMIPPSDQNNLLEQIFTVLYTTVIPMVNPLIYSLRNNKIKKAFQRLVAQLLHPH